MQRRLARLLFFRLRVGVLAGLAIGPTARCGGSSPSSRPTLGSRSVLNAPDLTAVGLRHLGVAYEIRHLRCPSCVKPGSPMPPYRALGTRRLRELALFLEASKGIP